MRQKQYTDKSPSREVEDEDWEATGQEEMNSLYVECKHKASVLDIRDRLNNLKELVMVCREALSESKIIDIKSIVGDVLYFHVEEQIRIAEEELCNL